MTLRIQKHGASGRLTYYADNGTIIGIADKKPIFVLYPDGQAFTTQAFFSLREEDRKLCFRRETRSERPTTISEETLKKMAEQARGIWT